MSHGSYYKIFMILKWPELEFSKIYVFTHLKFQIVEKWLILQCTVFLQRGSCIYSEKSYGMSHGSYYKIFMILRWVELEFSKINVFRAFQDPVTFGGFVLYFASLLNKMQHIGIYFHFVENAEVLMLRISCIPPECNYF